MRSSFGGLEFFPLLLIAVVLLGMSHSSTRANLGSVLHLDLPAAVSAIVRQANEAAAMEADAEDLEMEAGQNLFDAVARSVAEKMRNGPAPSLEADRLDFIELFGFVLAGLLSWFRPRRRLVWGAMAGVILAVTEVCEALEFGSGPTHAAELLFAAGLVLAIAGGAVHFGRQFSAAARRSRADRPPA